ncbi:MAG: HEAT repeat domain-containing protein, partial [bacterium]
ADEILDRQVAQILEKAPGRERLLSRVLEALKTPDNTKRYRSFEDLKDTLRTEKSFRLEKLLHYLSEHHLLREEKREGTAWFEFKHDYLVGKISDWLQKREKEKSRKRLRYVAAAPGLALLLGILAYVFYSYNSFYFGFVNAEYPGQLDEIAVFRQLDPLHSVITTGLLDKEGSEENAIMRDHAAKKDLKYHFNLGFWQNANWKSLAHKLQPMQGALLLYKIGEEKAGFDSLVAALKDEDFGVRTRAAALGNLGKSDDRVMAALVAALKDEDSDVRTRAAAALGNLGKSDDRVIAALVAALKDEDWNVFYEAVVALEKLGHSDDRVIATLFAALKHQYRSVRSQAATALGILGYSDGRVMAALVAALKDEDSG